jgi:transposase InsO family protein
LRRAVLACRHWARDVDVSTARVAAAMGLSNRTIRQWATHPAPHARGGRRRQPITQAEAVVMRTALIVHGPAASVATLQSWCPTASRRAIDRWLHADRQRRRAGLQLVRWHRPGRVWAMDFSEAPQPIEGAYRYVLHVRDLASQYHLAALPVARPTASAVCDLLRALCAITDAPLVLKVDNGAAFVSRELRDWARRCGTQLLYSPPCCPRYNGAIEASIASITTRAHHAAAAADHPESWTCDDVEAARASANAVVRRPSGRTAETSWRTASRITAVERRRFAGIYAASMRRRIDQPPRVQQRIAIVDTLRQLGYVSITRRVDLVQSLKSQKRQRLRG